MAGVPGVLVHHVLADPPQGRPRLPLPQFWHHLSYMVNRDDMLRRLGIETVFQDIRYAGRSLLRSPGFTAVVIVTLALGIGANLTMFSLMRAVLWRPLPYPEPNRIVVIQVDARNVSNTGATRAELLGIKERSRSFERVSMIDPVDANLEYAGEMEHVAAASVSDDFLPLLGVRPVFGRMLDSHLDVGKQQALAIMISDELWRRRFAADPGVIGRAVRINDSDMQIAGVLPPGFRLFLPPSVNGLEQIEVWLPERIDRTIPYRGVPVMARLRPGVTLDQANAELQMLAAQFEQENPDFYSGAKDGKHRHLIADPAPKSASRPGNCMMTSRGTSGRRCFFFRAR